MTIVPKECADDWRKIKLLAPREEGACQPHFLAPTQLDGARLYRCAYEIQVRIETKSVDIKSVRNNNNSVQLFSKN